MFSLIELTVITALFVNGLQIATSEGMLLSFIREWLDKVFQTGTVPDWDANVPQDKPVYHKAYYPILYCVKCMPSIYGTILCLIFLPLTPMLIYQIPIVLFCSCALSAILFQLYE